MQSPSGTRLRLCVAAFRLLLLACFGWGVAGSAARADVSDAELEGTFVRSVRPFLDTYCVSCHGAEKPEAGFELHRYTDFRSVADDLGAWSTILHKIGSNSMPPEGESQPPPAARAAVARWIETMRRAEARKHAGDPGVVLARRLNNAEYDSSVRDLTGVDLRPTREFPLDPANMAGFDNSGETLAMTPALFGKYLGAARDVADRMALTPDGIDFAPHPMLVDTDRDRYAIARIVAFYDSQPTDYADYFAAAWTFDHRAALGIPDATLDATASRAGLSTRYLATVAALLHGAEDDAGPLATVRARYRALPPPAGATEPAALRAGCVAMRGYVATIRKLTALEFAAPAVRGLTAYSPPLINWKLRQFTANRRSFATDAFRLASEPPFVAPPIPPYPALGEESAVRAAALMKKARAEHEPLLTIPEGRSREEWERAMGRFAAVFPDAFFIRERGRFFPDDSEDKGRLLSAGYHNVMGYWRDDLPLQELILDEQGRRRLDRLWDEFDFISDYSLRTWVQYFFNQSGELNGRRESGSQRPADKEISSPEVIFEVMDRYVKNAEANDNAVAADAARVHFCSVNDALRRMEALRAAAERKHLDALARFAARAFRRPLTGDESADIDAFYEMLRRDRSLTHEEAVRDSLVRLLMSPDFLYRIDHASDAAAADAAASSRGFSTRPLAPHALASRLSSFLWASLPDDELLAHAASGDLVDTKVLAAQTRRMLADAKARALAVEFGGQWLDYRRFEDHNGVDRGRFPEFSSRLREAMYEEPIRFLDDVFRSDRSVLELLYGRHTFVNPVLARHYGIPTAAIGEDEWVRVDDAQRHGRGGLLTMAVFLTQNASGLRTSPVKRGYWVARRLLGATIPPPPPDVPELPEDEARADLPLREMLARHRSNPTCASCHRRFDSFGVVLEGYGPVGERRLHDLAGRPVDTRTSFPSGAEGHGVDGLRAYVREHRQNDFLDTLGRRLLAYALGRSLIPSDELLVEEMTSVAADTGYRFAPLVEAIVTSPQFRHKRVAASAP
ncbi:MAG: DUF1592 domain-containing protein [Planctomycetia bacterium]